MHEQGELPGDWRLAGKEQQRGSVSGTWIPSRTTVDKYLPNGEETAVRELTDRWQRAIKMNASVVPIAPGMYRLVSEGSGNEYIIDLDGYANGDQRAVCECNDYRYNAGPKGVDCKHILFVKREVRNGLLPPAEADPVRWLESRLNEMETALNHHPGSESVKTVHRKVNQMRDRPYAFEYRQLVDDFHDATDRETHRCF